MSLEPKHEAATNLLGMSQYKIHLLDEAITTFEGLLLINKDSWQAFYGKGLAFLKLKRYDAASNNFIRASKFRPDHVDITEKIKIVNQQITRVETYVREVFQNGIDFHNQSMYREAIENYDKALEIINRNLEQKRAVFAETSFF